MGAVRTTRGGKEYLDYHALPVRTTEKKSLIMNDLRAETQG